MPAGLRAWLTRHLLLFIYFVSPTPPVSSASQSGGAAAAEAQLARARAAVARGEGVLLCDRCNDECHMRCLVPPLTAIPVGFWFCPRCERDAPRTIAQARVNEGTCHQVP